MTDNNNNYPPGSNDHVGVENAAADYTFANNTNDPFAEIHENENTYVGGESQFREGNGEHVDGEDGTKADDTPQEKKKDIGKIHPGSIPFFHAVPFLRYAPVFGQAVQGYGPKLVFALGINYLLCKGVADQLMQAVRRPFLNQHLGVDTLRCQRLYIMYTMGWALKAFVALATDSFALFGYTKRWYMFISCIVGGAIGIVMGLLPAKPSSGNIAGAFYFLTSLTKANVDILSEGHYSRQLKRNPIPGPSLVSWIWWNVLIGAIISSVINGPTADANIPQVAVLIAAVLQLITCFVFLLNWYGEKLNSEERLLDAIVAHKEAIKDHLDKEDEENKEFDSEEVVDGVERNKNLHPELSIRDPTNDYGGENNNNGNDPFNALHDDINLQEQQVQQESSNEVTLDGTDHSAAIHDAIEKGNLGIFGQEHIDKMSQIIPFIPPAPVIYCGGVIEFNREVLFKNWRVALYCALMTICVLTLAIVNLLCDTLGLTIACVIITIVCCALSFWALPLAVAKANIFAYIAMTLYMQIQAPVDNYYLAKPECVPDGPHFSNTFYLTVGQLVANVGGLLGVAAFNYFFSKRTYPIAIFVTTFIQMVASLFDIVIVMRWNKKAHIPDTVMYICGPAIVYQVCYMLSFMPMTILMARLCPRGSESMVYSLMAGFSNFGQTMSGAIGAILMGYVWPVSNNVPCDFHNLKWLLLVGHFIMPAFIVPFAYLLLPWRARICDNLDQHGNVIDEVEDEVIPPKMEQSNEQEINKEKDVAASG